MAKAKQDMDREAAAATARPEDADRYDPVRSALRSARDAFDPDGATREHRAATAPLVWYIEDTLDMALAKPAAGTDLEKP